VSTALGTGEHRTSWPGPLSAAVAELCQRLQPRVDERTAAGIGEVLRRLAAPLQVAVAGRIKSGKSTLINALIGRRVAPTDVAWSPASSTARWTGSRWSSPTADAGRCPSTPPA
jgi:50S ribosomal subunit-associated GTPase HflX